MKICKRDSSHTYNDNQRECPTCHKLRFKNYKINNPEGYRAYIKRKYERKYERDPEHIKQLKRESNARHSERGIWHNMKARCLNSASLGYKRYGGRGITVCERWLDFDNFFTDMGKRPSLQHTIERKDNNGNYEPDNCKWATRFEQARNRRDNHWVTYNNETKCLTDWAIFYNINQSLLSRRLSHGWDFEQAVQPVNIAKLEYNGEQKTINEWSEKFNVSVNCLYQRLYRGLSFKEAVEQKKYSHGVSTEGQKYCKKGHSYNDTMRECQECKTLRKKKWLQENPEAAKEARKRYRKPKD